MLKVTLTQSPCLPRRTGHPQSQTSRLRCSSKPLLAQDVVVPPQAAPSPLSPRLGTVHSTDIAQQWEGRVAPSGGASLAQVVAKARVVCACVIMRMTV